MPARCRHRALTYRRGNKSNAGATHREDPRATAPFRIYGSEMSPYSVKVRSYFRYKGLPHRWLIRNASNQADYQKYAKLPLSRSWSRRTKRAFRTRRRSSNASRRSIRNRACTPPIRRRVPVGAARGIRDEWATMDVPLSLGRRRPAERGRRIARQMQPRADESQHAETTGQIRGLVDRVWFVGSTRPPRRR